MDWSGLVWLARAVCWTVLALLALGGLVVIAACIVARTPAGIRAERTRVEREAAARAARVRDRAAVLAWHAQHQADLAASQRLEPLRRQFDAELYALTWRAESVEQFEIANRAVRITLLANTWRSAWTHIHRTGSADSTPRPSGSPAP